jgi:hypothetical protein
MELNMKPLNVRFDNTVFDTIESLSENTPHSKSDIARAAMQIGMKHLADLDARTLSAKINIAKLRIMFNGDDEAVDEALEQAYNAKK